MIFQLVNADHPYFNPFHIHNSGLIITEMYDPCRIQRGHGIFVALISVIMTVVIGCIYRFYRTICKDGGKRSRSLKCKSFILPCVGFGQSSLEIGNGQIIL